MDIGSTVTLNNGVGMPCLGFGTFRLEGGGEARSSVLLALKAGYRLIDTASMYGNEREVGAAVRESGIPREEVFITTKLWNTDHGYDRATAAFDESFRKLDLGYVDLYLIHWPVEGLRMDSWSAMESLLAGGRCRAVGVSNYMVNHLEELMASSDVAPAVNQFQLNPYCFQEELLDYCLKRGIAVQAYCPIARARRMGDPGLVDIAARYKKTPAQVLIRWSLQRGAVPVPKSADRERIVENADVFDFSISPADMEALDSFNEDLHVGWDPRGAP